MKTFQIGDTVRLTGTFRDEDKVLTDPTTVTVSTKTPGGVVQTWHYSTDADVIKDSTGKYHIDVAPDSEGRWTFQWKAEGTLVTLEEQHFLVRTPEIS